MNVKMLKHKLFTLFLLASLFVGLFSALPFVGATTNWLSGWSYRKSHVVYPASGAGTNYQIGIKVDYDYTAYYDLSTQWITISGNLTNRHNFEPVHNTNILEVDEVVDGATWKYLAYDCNSEGTQIRLYYTNDLNSSWTSYSGNPILSSSTAIYCWPTVVYNGTTFFMFVQDNADGGIKIYTSTDGITFTYLENVVVATTTIYMDTFPWFNPNDNRWYLYYSVYNTNPDEHKLLVRNSTTILGLVTATDKTVLTGGGFAAPTVMYRDGYYWLLVESGATGAWRIHAFWSSSPSSNFVESANSPILSENEACPVSLLNPDGTKAYLFTTHLMGGTWYEETREIYSTRPSSPPNNNEVNLNSLCRPDFGDIRFTSSDGSTLLNYWMESKVDSNYATFWVKITNDLSSLPATIYLYYGKSDATTTSSGADTFLLFDDFNDGSSDAMWTVGGTGGSISESGGTVTITAPSGGTEGIYSTTSFGLNTRVVANASRVITASGDPSADVGFRSAHGLYRAMGSGYQDPSSPNFYVETRNGGSVTELQGDLARDNNYHVFYVMRTSSSAVDLAVDSMATHNVRSTTNIPTGDVPAMASSFALGVNIVDWIAVTEYVSPEPSQGSWGSVQTYLSVAVSPSSSSLDVGQSQLFTATVTGSASPYTYQWYLNDSKISGATSSIYTFTPSSTGSGSLYVNVTDSLGDTAVSTAVSITVSSTPSVSILPSSITLDVGQSQAFTSSVSDGTSPYTYQWYLNDAPVFGATSDTWLFAPVSSGVYAVYLNVTDGVGVIAISNTATVTVNATLSVSISPSSATLDVGQSQTFTSSVSYGTSPYQFQWYQDGVLVGGNSTSWTFSPFSSGSYTVYLNVTDSLGEVAMSNIVTVTVNALPSVTILPTYWTMDVGQSRLLTSTVLGGTSPYSYQWFEEAPGEDTYSAVEGAISSSYTFTTTNSTVTGVWNLVLQVTDDTATAVNSTAVSVTVRARAYVLVPLSGWEEDPLYTNASYVLNSLDSSLYVELDATDTSSKVAIFSLNAPQLSLSSYAYVDATVTGTSNAKILLRFFMDDGNSFDAVYWQNAVTLNSTRFDLGPYAGRTLTGLVYVGLMSADGTPANINITQIAFVLRLLPPSVPLSGWHEDPLYTNASYVLSGTASSLYLELDATDTSSKVVIFNLNVPQLSLSRYTYVSATVVGTDNARLTLRFFMDDGSSFDVVYWESPTTLNATKLDLSPYAGRTLTGLVYVALMSADGTPADINITRIAFEALPPTVPLSGWAEDPLYTNAPYVLSGTASSLYLELDATDTSSEVAVFNINAPKLSLSGYTYVGVTLTGTDNGRILLRFFMDDGNCFDVVYWENPATLNVTRLDLSPYAGRTLTGVVYVALMSADAGTAYIRITQITFETQPIPPLAPLSNWQEDPQYTNATYVLSSSTSSLYLELDATDTSSKVAIFNLNTPKLSLSDYSYVDVTVTGTSNAKILLRFFMDDGNSFDVSKWNDTAMLNAKEFDLSSYAGRTLTGLVYVALMSADGTPANINITRIAFVHV